MPVQSSGMRAVESQAIGPPNLEHESNLLDAAERRRLDTGHTTFMTKGEVSHEEFERDVLKLVGGPVPAEATFERLQADPATREIPVILLTAKLQPADRARFAELGVRALVAKPFDPMTLPDEVAEILGWPR
jgi:DNA-binding response OmpR family regulator